LGVVVARDQLSVARKASGGRPRERGGALLLMICVCVCVCVCLVDIRNSSKFFVDIKLDGSPRNRRNILLEEFRLNKGSTQFNSTQFHSTQFNSTQFNSTQEEMLVQQAL
jgi:hypothetical protein